jgi:hypothetical protein
MRRCERSEAIQVAARRLDCFVASLLAMTTPSSSPPTAGPVGGDDAENECAMPQPLSAYDAHQRERWLRHDAHLWIRNDAARWLKPGTDSADVFPALKRQREAVGYGPVAGGDRWG